MLLRKSRRRSGCSTCGTIASTLFPRRSRRPRSRGSLNGCPDEVGRSLVLSALDAEWPCAAPLRRVGLRNMPSMLHEGLLLLFRNRPTLAPELLRDALGIPLPAYTEARV